MKYSLVAALLFGLGFSTEKLPVSIQTDSPSYRDDLLETSSGAIVKSNNLYLQANSISYNLTKGNQTLKASGNLFVIYYGQAFVAEEFFYDFQKQEGFLIKPIASIDLWYLQSDKASLKPDSHYVLKNLSITTSDLPSSEWCLFSKNVEITKDKTLKASSIEVRALKIPIFWIPKFQTNLSSYTKSPVKYQLKWISGQGPQVGFRYKLYSSSNFSSYLRAQYLYARGFSGALEFEGSINNIPSSYFIKNYLAHDTFYRDNNPNKRKTRYRLQGHFHSKSASDHAEVTVDYDKYSDKNLPSEFPGEDFEFNKARKSLGFARYNTENFLTSIEAMPRLNSFEGFKQKLPEINFHVKPMSCLNSNLLFFNQFKLSFLDYSYTNLLSDAPPNFQNALEDFHSLRGQTRQKLTLPINIHGLKIKPFGGYTGIIYSDNPQNMSAYQGVFDFGFDSSIKFTKATNSYSHSLSPYCHYLAFNKPLKKQDNVYIFGIEDGYHEQSFVRAGLNQSLYLHSPYFVSPMLSLDTYTLGFLSPSAYKVKFPKVGYTLMCQTPTWELQNHMQWNINNQLLDLFNIQLKMTLGINTAFSLEFRHRSKYYFRKEDDSNYTFEFARQLDELLNSPLSDGRNTLLSKLEFKLLPQTTIQLQTQTGWGRRNQKSYNEAKLDVISMLSTSWKLRVSYAHTTLADLFTFSINLVK